MPRKKVTSPATAEQVLDYFETASDVEVKLVASLVEGKLRKRFAPTLTPTRAAAGGSAPQTRKPRAPKQTAPAQYGETLGEA